MIRFSLNMEFGRVKDEPEPEELPGGTHGNAQVEDAGYGSADVRPLTTGFGMPYVEDPGPEGPYQ